MGNYNWKAHYAVQLTEQEHSDAFCIYEIEDKAGKGKVVSCTVFPGIQAVYNDLKISHCGRTVPRKEEIVEINYCIEGRYECEVNNQYCFFASPGDLSVGIVGRREAAGGFPTGHFTGLTLFIELPSTKEHNSTILQELGIDLDTIHLMAVQEPRRFYIRGRKEKNPSLQCGGLRQPQLLADGRFHVVEIPEPKGFRVAHCPIEH